jgi:hypothetical protein
MNYICTFVCLYLGKIILGQADHIQEAKRVSILVQNPKADAEIVLRQDDTFCMIDVAVSLVHHMSHLSLPYGPTSCFPRFGLSQPKWADSLLVLTSRDLAAATQSSVS